MDSWVRLEPPPGTFNGPPVWIPSYLNQSDFASWAFQNPLVTGLMVFCKLDGRRAVVDMFQTGPIDGCCAATNFRIVRKDLVSANEFPVMHDACPTKVGDALPVLPVDVPVAWRGADNSIAPFVAKQMAGLPEHAYGSVLPSMALAFVKDRPTCMDRVFFDIESNIFRDTQNRDAPLTLKWTGPIARALTWFNVPDTHEIVHDRVSMDSGDGQPPRESPGAFLEPMFSEPSLSRSDDILVKCAARAPVE